MLGRATARVATEESDSRLPHTTEDGRRTEWLAQTGGNDAWLYVAWSWIRCRTQARA